MNSPLIDHLQLFGTIQEDHQSLIDMSFEPKGFKEGEYLSRKGRTCRELFFVNKGVLKIVTTNQKGIDVIHFFIGENQCCTLLESFNNNTPASECIQAACDTEVLSITNTGLLNLYDQLPYLENIFYEVWRSRLLKKVHLRNAYLGLDSMARYKKFIELQHDVAGRVSSSDIASYLEITPQSLSRIRKSMR